MAVVESFADESAYLKLKNSLGIGGRKDLLLPLAQRQSFIEYVRGLEVGYKGWWTTPTGIQTRQYWDSPEGQKVIQQADKQDVLTTLTDLFRRCSDEQTVACISKAGGADGIRAFVERTNPKTQCSRTISGVTKETLCWICGGGGFKDTADGLELRPECEHVFPIAQAICFSGLYESQLVNEIAATQDKTAADAYVTAVAYEYRWAHRICNQVKRDMHFIIYNPDLNKTADARRIGGFAISDAKIRELLTNIETTESYGTGRKLMAHLNARGPAQIEAWKQQRIPEIRRISKQLIDLANTAGLTAEQHARVTVMSVRSYLATHPECTKQVEDIPKSLARQSLPGALHPIRSNAFLENYTRMTIQDVTGVMNAHFRQSGRSLSSVNRARISFALSKVGPEDPTVFNGVMAILNPPFLDILRRQLYYYLKVQPGAPMESRWSEFQVLLGQLIAAEVCGVAAGTTRLLVSVPKDIKPLLQSAALELDLKRWVQTKIDTINRPFQVAGQAPIDIYTKIRATPGDVDPRPDIPAPTWLLLGGGHTPIGGLRPRRPLYSNVQVSDSLPLLTDDDSGLRKRSRTRRTRRVRQSPRKSKTRR